MLGEIPVYHNFKNPIVRERVLSGWNSYKDRFPYRKLPGDILCDAARLLGQNELDELYPIPEDTDEKRQVKVKGKKK